jgi:hypothetical protein
MHAALLLNTSALGHSFVSRLQAATAPPPLPKQWDAIDKANSNKVFVLLDNVKHSTELAAVKAHWKKSGGVGTIVAVHRVQNAAQYRRFHQAGIALCGTAEHVQLNAIVYHGTRANAPWLICESDGGFDPSKGKAMPGSVSATLFEHAAVAETQSSFCLFSVR